MVRPYVRCYFIVAHLSPPGQTGNSMQKIVCSIVAPPDFQFRGQAAFSPSRGLNERKARCTASAGEVICGKDWISFEPLGPEGFSEEPGLNSYLVRKSDIRRGMLQSAARYRSSAT